MVQVLKSAQDFELFGGFKPWHRQGEHLKIQKPKRFWADAPFLTPQLLAFKTRNLPHYATTVYT
jgi:hypothetical protein